MHFHCVCMMLLIVYLHVDVPLDFEALGTFFTASVHALSTTGLREVDNDTAWCLEEHSQSYGHWYTSLPMMAYSKFIFTFICNWQIFLLAITLKSITSLFVASRISRQYPSIYNFFLEA